MIFAAGLGNNLQKIIQFRNAKEPFIDFNLLLIVMPGLCAGSIFGQILHNMVAEAIIFLLLVYVMIDAIRSIMKKLSSP